MCLRAPTGESENNKQESIFALEYKSFRDGAQVVRFGGEQLYQLSHFLTPPVYTVVLGNGWVPNAGYHTLKCVVPQECGISLHPSPCHDFDPKFFLMHMSTEPKDCTNQFETHISSVSARFDLCWPLSCIHPKARVLWLTNDLGGNSLFR